MPTASRVLAFSRARSLEFTAVLTPAVAAVTSVLIARTVDAAGRGEVVLIATWAAMTGWIGVLSIDKAMIARSGVDNQRQTDIPLAAGLTVLLTAGTVAALLGTLVSVPLMDHGLLRAAMFATVLGTVAVEARTAALLISDQWRQFVALRFAQPAVYLAGCATVAALATVFPSLGVDAFLGALCVSLWLPALFVGGLPRWRPRLPTIRQLRTMFAFAGAYHLGAVLNLLSLRVDVLAMPLRFGLTEIGIYAVACSAGYIVAPLASAGLIRNLAGRAGQPGRAGPIDLPGLAIATALAASVAVLIGWLIPLVYGPAFAAAIAPAQVLCLGGVLRYVTQGINGQLAGQGRPGATALVNGVAVVTFLALFPRCDTLVELAAAGVASAVTALCVAWYLIRPGRSTAARRSVAEIAAGTPDPTVFDRSTP